MILSYPDEKVSEAKTYLAQYSRKPFRRNSIHPYEWIYLAEECNRILPYNILEVGVYLYTSSLAFLRHMETSSRAQLISVDPIHNRGGIEFRHHNDSVNSRWFRVIARSQDYLPKLPPETFDLIFIDGDHSAEAVQEDAKNALRLIAHNGTIIFHDFGSKPLRQAVFNVLSEDHFAEIHTGYSRVPSHGIGVYRARSE